MKNQEFYYEEFEKALLQINRIKAGEIFEECFAEEKTFSVLEDLTITVLERIGLGWESGSISLSQVYMSGIICEELIDKFMPVFEVKRIDNPKIAIAVLLDHHGLGKRIVYSILRAGGYEVLDFGQGISIEALVQKTIENDIDVLLISTLMLPSALKIKAVKEKLEARGNHTKIIAGGAPFRMDTNLWKNVHADADGKSASTIIRTVESVLKGDA